MGIFAGILGRSLRFDPDARIQMDRWIAGGGTVIDPRAVDASIKHAKAFDYWSYVQFWASASFGVKKDGSGAVSKWYCLKGNDAVQATGSAQPIWTANQKNGRAAIVWDNTDDALVSSVAVNQPIMMIAVAQIGITAGVNRALLDGVDGTDRMIYYWDGSTTKWNLGGSITGGAASAEWLIHAALQNGATSWIFQNGSSIATGATGAANLTGITIGRRYALTAGSLPWNGPIAELVLLGTSSATHRQNVETHLNSRYLVY